MFTHNTFRYLREVMLFSIPLIIGQVGQMLFSIGDLFVAGMYSNESVAAIGVASGILSPFIMVGVASLFSVSSISARLRGQAINPHKEGVWGSTIVFSLLLATLMSLALYIFTFFVGDIGLAPEIVEHVEVYLVWVNLSIFPAFIFQAAKEYLQAFEKTIFANGLIIFMNVVNVFMNYALMFGIGPIPELGIKGAAIATVITRTVLAIILVIYTYRKLPLESHFDKSMLKDLARLGLPIGVGTLVEVLMFSAVTVLIGGISVVASAAHNIVLNIAGLTFMVPLAINGAAGVKVGYAYGKRDTNLIRAYAYCCIIIAEVYMLLMAISYFFFSSSYVGIFTSDPEIISYGLSLFLYVALFQIPDGLQVTMLGILRGMGMTKLPMIISFIGYWLIAIPSGYYLAFHKGMEASGLWAGLAIGLTIVSVILSITFIFKLKNLDREFQSQAT